MWYTDSNKAEAVLADMAVCKDIHKGIKKYVRGGNESAAVYLA